MAVQEIKESMKKKERVKKDREHSIAHHSPRSVTMPDTASLEVGWPCRSLEGSNTSRLPTLACAICVWCE